MNTEKAQRSVLGGMVGAAIAVAALLALSPSYAHAERRGIINMPVIRMNVPAVGLHTLRGSSDTTPPDPTSNTGGNTSTDQSNPIGNSASSNGAGGAGASNQNQGEGSGNNGGTQAGNGGNGGDGGNASPGGLVRAGSVVSNANALNMLNVNIVRISSR